MTLQEYLAAEGLTPEEIAAVVGNDKQAKAMAKALGLADEGRAALTKAQQERQETEQFWEQKTTELQGAATRLTAAERKAAEADAERARYGAYLKSLKDQGYDVPDSLLQANPAQNPNPARNPETGQYLTREDATKLMRGTAPDLVSLQALSNEYSYLFGQPYTSIDVDFAEAQKAGKPLTEFARSKYNFAAKKQEKDNAAAEAAYQKRYAEDMAKEKAKWAIDNGSNPDTAAPVQSKFSRLERTEGFKNDSWKSQEGRAASRASRLERFKNAPIIQ